MKYELLGFCIFNIYVRDFFKNLYTNEIIFLIHFIILQNLPPLYYDPHSSSAAVQALLSPVYFASLFLIFYSFTSTHVLLSASIFFFTLQKSGNELHHKIIFIHSAFRYFLVLIQLFFIKTTDILLCFIRFTCGREVFLLLGSIWFRQTHTQQVSSSSH